MAFCLGGYNRPSMLSEVRSWNKAFSFSADVFSGKTLKLSVKLMVGHRHLPASNPVTTKTTYYVKFLLKSRSTRPFQVLGFCEHLWCLPAPPHFTIYILEFQFSSSVTHFTTFNLLGLRWPLSPIIICFLFPSGIYCYFFFFWGFEEEAE